MYKLLQKLGTRGRPAGQGYTITKEEFKRHFERVYKYRNKRVGTRGGWDQNYIKYACDDMKTVMVELVQLMFQSRANEWSEGLKTGVIVPVFKKGDIGDVNNYRGVCLLTMESHTISGIIAKRVGVWAEALQVLDENQADFRRGRSTADIVQVIVRIEEGTRDWKGRAEEYDLAERKGILARYGMKGHCLETIKNLHEATS